MPSYGFEPIFVRIIYDDSTEFYIGTGIQLGVETNQTEVDKWKRFVRHLRKHSIDASLVIQQTITDVEYKQLY